MVKFYEGVFSLNFNWEEVAQAFWQRYPNPYSNHVLSEDVLVREVRSGLLYSKRLLTKTNRVPDWGKRFFNSRAICILEESVVDPKAKTIVTYTRNIGFSHLMTVEEKCIYRQGDDGLSTTIDRQAWIASNVFGFSRAIQAFGLDRFRKNTTKATRGFRHVVEAMFGDSQKLAPMAAPMVHIIDKAKLKETAIKATELAKSKATPLVAACSTNNNQRHTN